MILDICNSKNAAVILVIFSDRVKNWVGTIARKSVARAGEGEKLGKTFEKHSLSLLSNHGFGTKEKIIDVVRKDTINNAYMIQVG